MGETGDLEFMHCSECFVRYAAPKALFQARRTDGRTFYCPNGHAQAYRESENDRIRRERDRLKQENARLAEEAKAGWATASVQAERRREAEHQARAFKGVATRIKNRLSAGVCPCCNRTFKQLAAHMAKQHPGYRAEEIAPEGATIQ